MIRWLLRALVILFGVALTCLVIFTSGLEYQRSLKPVSPPEFTAKTLEGESLTLSHYKGKIILLHFWASWCGPCKVEFPDLLAIAKQYPEQLVVLAVAADEEPDAIPPFLKGLTPAFHAKDYPNVKVIWDKDKAISATLYQTRQYPESYIIDHQFHIRDKIAGVEPDWQSRIAPFIAGCPLAGAQPERKENP